MVSFNCDVCQDVVKKPKLDAHSYRCHGSFTCVDCSKTFSAPAEWKGHTSCISEAEKYQKGLYKSKKAKQNEINAAAGREPSKPEEKTKNKPSEDQNRTQGTAQVEVSTQDTASPGGEYGKSKNSVTEATQAKEVNENEKKKRRKAKEEPKHKVADDSFSKKGRKKRKKKQRLDAEGGDEPRTKKDRADRKQVKEKEAPLSSGAASTDPEEGRSKKENKKKKKKANKNLLDDSAVDQASAPSQTDTRHQVDLTKEDEGPSEGKADKVEESKKVDSSHLGENAVDMKMEKKRARKEKEGRDANQDDQSRQGKKRKRPDTEDGNENENRSIKAMKDKRKKRKSEAVDQNADAS